MNDKREAVKVLQPDGTIKILFRTTHESVGMKQEPQKDTIQEKPQNTDSHAQNIKKHEKGSSIDAGRFFNPWNPGFADIFGKNLIGKTMNITLLNGEILSGVLRGFGQYDILLESGGKNVILMKSGIVKIEVQNEPEN
ncbi:RNA chaperone Hfq [Ferroplasma acidarmanus]|uniref:LSM domain-containing protein n=1 Tax=Ferroplasma acidarmanus Fer1 TaxID=333146 RepID=S0ATJ1_FERAC|nr:RNA chaperone Hfq [Ferroplasma acidarmanus]AGO61404.1 hypothetical protein FACI_IFERC00001G1424 [Ferroplasma acidarmanus Fer1]